MAYFVSSRGGQRQLLLLVMLSTGTTSENSLCENTTIEITTDSRLNVSCTGQQSTADSTTASSTNMVDTSNTDYTSSHQTHSTGTSNADRVLWVAGLAAGGGALVLFAFVTLLFFCRRFCVKDYPTPQPSGTTNTNENRSSSRPIDGDYLHPLDNTSAAVENSTAPTTTLNSGDVEMNSYYNVVQTPVARGTEAYERLDAGVSQLGDNNHYTAVNVQ